MREGGTAIDAEALRELLQARGLTHAALAEAAGVSRPAVTKLLNGTGDPKHSTVAGVAMAMGLTCEEIGKMFYGLGNR